MNFVILGSSLLFTTAWYCSQNDVQSVTSPQNTGSSSVGNLASVVDVLPVPEASDGGSVGVWLAMVANLVAAWTRASRSLSLNTAASSMSASRYSTSISRSTADWAFNLLSYCSISKFNSIQVTVLVLVITESFVLARVAQPRAVTRVFLAASEMLNLTAKQIEPQDTERHFVGFYGVTNQKKSGEAVKRLDRLAPNLGADLSGNGHRLNTICPSTFGEGG